MRRKIHVVHMISTFERSDAQMVLYELIKHADQSLFDQSVIYFKEGPLKDRFEQLGIPLVHVSGRFFQYDITFFWRLFTALKIENADCLHTLLWGSNFLGKIFGRMLHVPVIQAIHDFKDSYGFIKNSIERLFAPWTTPMVAASYYIAESIATATPWFKKNAVTIIKNGVDISDVISENKKERKDRAKDLGLDDSHFIIGTVGKFEASSNYSFLLTAFALLYDTHHKARLLLIGTGSQEYFLKKRAFDLGIEDRVIFVTDDGASGYYSLLDCFILTKLKEGISIPLLEAMSFSVPPIVSSLYEKHEIIEHEKNGLVVLNGNIHLMALYMMRLSDDDVLRSKLGQEARTFVELNFKADQMVVAYEKLYQNVSKKSLKDIR